MLACMSHSSWGTNPPTITSPSSRNGVASLNGKAVTVESKWPSWLLCIFALFSCCFPKKAPAPQAKEPAPTNEQAAKEPTSPAPIAEPAKEPASPVVKKIVGDPIDPLLLFCQQDVFASDPNHIRDRFVVTCLGGKVAYSPQFKIPRLDLIPISRECTDLFYQYYWKDPELYEDWASFLGYKLPHTLD